MHTYYQIDHPNTRDVGLGSRLRYLFAKSELRKGQKGRKERYTRTEEVGTDTRLFLENSVRLTRAPRRSQGGAYKLAERTNERTNERARRASERSSTLYLYLFLANVKFSYGIKFYERRQFRNFWSLLPVVTAVLVYFASARWCFYPTNRCPYRYAGKIAEPCIACFELSRSC